MTACAFPRQAKESIVFSKKKNVVLLADVCAKKALKELLALVVL